MYQVRIYLVINKKYPARGRGYYGYRLETVTKSGKLHVKEFFDVEEDITANQLALVAMYRAFEELKKPCEVEVYTDSLYLRSNFIGNLQNWTLNAWMNAKGKQVANKELWNRLDEVTKKHLVRFETAYDYAARASMTEKVLKMKMEDARRGEQYV